MDGCPHCGCNLIYYVINGSGRYDWHVKLPERITNDETRKLYQGEKSDLCDEFSFIGQCPFCLWILTSGGGAFEPRTKAIPVDYFEKLIIERKQND